MKMWKSKRVAWGVSAAAVLVVAAGPALAGWGDAPSKVAINNIRVEPRDGKTRTLSFDISWDNSWRYENNHDAVWLLFPRFALKD